MVALWNRADHYIFILWFLSIFYLLSFSSPNLSGRTLNVYHTSTHSVCGLSANSECRSETCGMRLAENAGPKKVAKNRHLGTIAQLCRAISSQLRHVSTIGKKLVKQQYVLQMSPHYGEHRPTNSRDRLAGLGHPIIFQRVSRLGKMAALHARQSSIAGVSQTLRRWTEGAIYVRQGDHHVGHWPTFSLISHLFL